MNVMGKHSLLSSNWFGLTAKVRRIATGVGVSSLGVTARMRRDPRWGKYPSGISSTGLIVR